jgi:hypothetical protein
MCAQRIPKYAMEIAAKLADHLPDEDSTLSFFNIANVCAHALHLSYATPVRVFVSSCQSGMRGARCMLLTRVSSWQWQPHHKSKRVASRIFYNMLILQNEGIIDMEQPEPYEDMIIKQTATTLNYRL